MGKAGLRIHGCIVWCGLALSAGCGSADSAPAAPPDADWPDAPAAPPDANWPDAPAPRELDAPAAQSDAPNPLDALIGNVDSPLGEDGARPDGHYFRQPDGRELLRVDYCLPILALPADGRDCPSTLDGARALVMIDALDGGSLDGGRWDDGRPKLEGCVEPLFVFLPRGRSLGWNVACYYAADSQQLVSIIEGTDTPTECPSSPVPNTAAFTYKVYGQYVRCAWPGPG
jgi:hypothetical protein